MLRVIALAVLLTALAPGVARGAPWRWPVRGQVVGSYSMSPDAPYAAGQRRGIAIAAPPGTAVVSVCAGRVAFAGSVGRAGPTVSVQCGSLRATYQGLAAIEEEEGAIVLPGQTIARLGTDGVLRLGARVARNHYVDPATLFAAERPPLGPAPRAPRRRTRRRPPQPTLPLAAPDRQPQPTPAGAPASPQPAPLLAWLGLALLATAAPIGALRRRSRRAATRRATALVSES